MRSSRRSAPAIRSRRPAPLPDPEADRRAEAREREQRDDRLAHDARAQQPGQEHDGRGSEQREQRRQPGPVDVRALGRRDDHRAASRAGSDRALASRIDDRTEGSLRLSAELRIQREGDDHAHQRRHHEPVGQADLARGDLRARRGCASRG